MKDIRNEFSKLLTSININSTTSSEVIIESITEIQRLILDNIPASLYRYRKFSEYVQDDIINGVITGSRPSTFNDLFEGKGGYDLKEFFEIVYNASSIENAKIAMDELSKGKIPDSLRALKMTSDDIDKLFDQLKRTTPSELQAQVSHIRDYIMHLLDKLGVDLFTEFSNLMSFYQERNYISCLCESNKSTSMWGLYADSNKGICLEYDFRDLIHPVTDNSILNLDDYNTFLLSPLLAPVIYSEKQCNAVALLLWSFQRKIHENLGIKYDTYLPDLLIFIKCLLTKSMEWQNEKEWRLIKINDDNLDNKYGKICKLVPKAIYVGKKFESCNIPALKQIASKTNIPIYQMYDVVNGLGYEMKATKLEL